MFWTRNSKTRDQKSLTPVLRAPALASAKDRAKSKRGLASYNERNQEPGGDTTVMPYHLWGDLKISSVKYLHSRFLWLQQGFVLTTPMEDVYGNLRHFLVATSLRMGL